MITKRTAARVTVLATTIAIAACSDSTLTNPNTRPGLSRASFTTGAVKTAFDFPVSFEGPLNWVSCVDPNSPPLAHVNGVVHVSTLTTPSGVTTTTSLFEIDRDNTWVLYNGLTYHIARGRPGKDDITHVITTPQGLYVETSLEPDFEVTDNPSERLQLNFHLQIVVDPNGNTRVTKSTGSCPFIL
jgi:hypothetical protein